MMQPVQVDLLGETDAERKFNEFHRKNPEVYKELEKLAYRAYNNGRKKIGMQMLVEVFRWNKMLTTKGDAFKINNNYGSRYARLIMDNNPQLQGLFELRKLRK